MHVKVSHVLTIAEGAPAESIIVKSLTLSLLSASAAGGGLLDVAERCVFLKLVYLIRTSCESRRGNTEAHEAHPNRMRSSL